MRGNATLRRKYAAVLAYVGITMVLAGAVMLFPLVALVAWPEEARLAKGFLAPGLASIVGGLLVYFALRPRREILNLQEGAVLVLLSWLVACALGAIPFMLVERLSLTQAALESVSGWTTTGLSVVDVTHASRMTLLYRSALQLVGGAGFAIVMVATLIGPTGSAVSGAEGRTDYLVPHVRQSARIVILLYLGYTRGRHRRLRGRGNERLRRGQSRLRGRFDGRLFDPAREHRLLELRGRRGREPRC